MGSFLGWLKSLDHIEGGGHIRSLLVLITIYESTLDSLLMTCYLPRTVNRIIPITDFPYVY